MNIRVFPFQLHLNQDTIARINSVSCRSATSTALLYGNYHHWAVSLLKKKVFIKFPQFSPLEKSS